MSQFYAVAVVESSPVALACDCLAQRFGNAADHGMRERRYPTDRSDAETYSGHAGAPPLKLSGGALWWSTRRPLR